MGVPSVKLLMCKLGLSEGLAHIVRGGMLLTEKLDIIAKDKAIKSIAKRLNKCDSKLDGKLTHGVEYIHEHNSKGKGITYINVGDGYGITILIVGNDWKIGAWANYID